MESSWKSRPSLTLLPTLQTPDPPASLKILAPVQDAYLVVYDQIISAISIVTFVVIEILRGSDRNERGVVASGFTPRYRAGAGDKGRSVARRFLKP